MFHRRRGRRGTPGGRGGLEDDLAGARRADAFEALAGLDSLLSIVQMPKGIPVATFAIGDAGAANAGLFAVAMLALNDAALAKKLTAFRAKQVAAVKAVKLPELS